jgi:hypothetical protein
MKTAKDGRREAPDAGKSGAEKEPSFSPDRKGESSAGALTRKDKERSVAADRDGSNTR